MNLGTYAWPPSSVSSYVAGANADLIRPRKNTDRIAALRKVTLNSLQMHAQEILRKFKVSQINSRQMYSVVGVSLMDINFCLPTHKDIAAPNSGMR